MYQSCCSFSKELVQRTLPCATALYPSLLSFFMWPSFLYVIYILIYYLSLRNILSYRESENYADGNRIFRLPFFFLSLLFAY